MPRANARRSGLNKTEDSLWRKRWVCSDFSPGDLFKIAKAARIRVNERKAADKLIIGARVTNIFCQLARWSKMFILQIELMPFIRGQFDIWPWASVIMLMPNPKTLTPMKRRSIDVAKIG